MQNENQTDRAYAKVNTDAVQTGILKPEGEPPQKLSAVYKKMMIRDKYIKNKKRFN